jgi:Flp pilus assembly protein TadG
MKVDAARPKIVSFVITTLISGLLVSIPVHANATVAAKVATAAKAAAAKVPSKAVVTAKPSTSTNKNSAKATVTGLKPGQKVKVTVNVRPKP